MDKIMETVCELFLSGLETSNVGLQSNGKIKFYKKIFLEWYGEDKGRMILI